MIFVVDSDTSICRSLTRLFHAEGFGVATFESGQTFLDSANPGSGDFILVDATTTDLTGFEVTKALAQRNVSAPIIMTSTSRHPKARQQAHHGGAIGYFCKPVDGYALIDCIRFAQKDRG